MLLILAVVAITSISNSNIIKHAQNGRDAYDLAKKNEQGTLAKYEQYLDDNNPSNNNGNKDDDPPKGNEDNIDWFYLINNGYKVLVYIGNDTEITLRGDLSLNVYTSNEDPVSDETNDTLTYTASETKMMQLKDENIDYIEFAAGKDRYIFYTKEGTKIKEVPEECSITKITFDKDIYDKYNESELITNNTKEVVVLDGVTTIYQGSFCEREKLEKVTLPNTITTIEMENFLGCTQPIVIEYNGTKAQWNSIAIENTSEISNVTVKCTDGNITY